MKKIILLLLLPLMLMASEISGEISSCLSREPLGGAIVRLVDMSEGTVIQTVISDKEGRYFMPGVKSGIYQLEASKPNYYKNILFDFQVNPQQDYECNIDLLEKTKRNRRKHGMRRHGHRHEKDSDYCFMIGSIEVKSHGEELIPEESVTTRKISSGEIEHMQATNLGDVLNLIPGVEKTQNPGLSKQSYAGIRSVSLQGSDGYIESYGTSIVVDGNTISTAADLGQTGRSGVDLRTIPADNIESVEVITGIPSAEYGNFSNGLIKVKTKSGYMINKVKGKINPDTKTASYSGGHKFTENYIDYHFNYGFSERDLREDGDEYHRIYGKLAYTHPFMDEKLNTRTQLTYTRTLDSDAPYGIYNMRNYNEGYKTSALFNLDYDPNDEENYTGLISLNVNRRKEFKEKFVTDQVFIPEGVFVEYEGKTLTDTTMAGYVGKHKNLGYEINLNANVKYSRQVTLANTEHTFAIGLNSKYDTNVGDGIVLDEFWNYYGIASDRRSYAFDEYGGLQQHSLFVQDKLSGKLFNRRYNLNLGLRYSVFNPEGIDFSKGIFDDRNGEFLSPRFNFQYFLTDDLRFRIGAGQSVQATSLSYMYRGPAYFKYINEDSVLVEDVEFQENPGLSSYSTKKYEASIDWRPVDLVGFSLTGYYSYIDNRPSSRGYPFGYQVNPDTLTAASYSIYENRGWKDYYGLEFTLRTKRIKNLQFNMNITYRYSETGRRKTAYDSKPNRDYGETPWYKPASNWREKVVVDYQLNYVSQRLGAWITLDVQQVPMEYKKTEYHSTSYMRKINEEEYLFYQGMNDWWDKELFDYSNHWLFNLRITKSLTRKSELSLYINNLFDDRALWNHPYTDWDQELNPEIYYGLEVSTQW